MTTEPLIRCAHTRLIPTAEAMALRRPDNPNIHSPEQLRMFGKIIAATGFRRAARISKRSGKMTVGHGMTEAAALAGFPFVPIDEQEYESQEQEDADVLADNLLQDLSTLDDELTKALAESLAAADFDTEIAGLTNDLFADMTEPEPEESAPDTVATNLALMETIKMRRAGNKKTGEKNDTEKYLVIVFPTRAAREKALRRLGLPEDERYVPAASVKLTKLAVSAAPSLGKAATSANSGACG